MGWLLLALAGLVYFGLGPWSLLLGALLLAVPRIRARLPRPELTRRGLKIAVPVLLLLGLAVWAVPDGRLPIPSAGGVLVTPFYEGRQVQARPVQAAVPPQHPWLAPMGSSAVNGDAWSSGASQGPGPLGDSPESRSAWYGLEQCGSLAFDRHGRLIAMCEDRKGPRLRVINADNLRALGSKRLPSRSDSEEPASHAACQGSRFYLDNGDRAIVTTAERRIQAIGTSDADGLPDLTVDESWGLEALIPESDCLVAVKPDWAGRIWWTSHDGRVGVVDPVSGEVSGIELGERVTNNFAVDESGGVFLVSDAALYRLALDETGTPVVTWRTEYDRGVEVKPGQLVQGSGTTPTLVDENLVVIADNAEPRLRVVFLDRATGEEVCSSAVFDGGESATESSLSSVGSGVVVENNHGYTSPRSTLVGFSSSPGLARVDQSDGECSVVWTNDEVASAALPLISWQTGLLYTFSKRSTLWGVSAWYLTAVDAHTGSTAFSVRAGNGLLFNGQRSAVALGPDGSAYIGALGGVVRVHDRQRD